MSNFDCESYVLSKLRHVLIAFSDLQDKKASLIIHHYVDDIIEKLMEALNLTIPGYNPEKFLSTVSIFSKSKGKREKIESKYGTIKSADGSSEAKKPKLETSEQDKKNQRQEPETDVKLENAE